MIHKPKETEERMESMSQVELLSKQSRGIEREIVTFYKTVGKMVNLTTLLTQR